MKSLKPHLIRLKPDERLHHLSVPVIGLTGGIATGKSSVARLLKDRGIPVLDADALVKEIYKKKETKDFITSLYPDCVQNGEVNFPQLRKIFFNEKSAKETIERFIYQALPTTFLDAYKKLGAVSLVAYDVPLLFEKGLERLVDVSVVVYVPEKTQLQRLMLRDGTDQSMARKILTQQLPIEVKKEKANFFVDNSGAPGELTAEVDQLLRQLMD